MKKEVGEAATDWHAQDAAVVAAQLGVDPRIGLDPAEVLRRRERFGRNELTEQRRYGPLRMLLGQFTDFMIVVLLIAALIAGALGEVLDTVVILVIVALNGVIGFVQEYRAERAVAALRRLGQPAARVRRDGRIAVVPRADVVPGDIVLLDAGSVVPADLRLLELAQLRVDESVLTGESVPVEKTVDRLDPGVSQVADRVNLAFQGTTVTYGRGTGVVVATGMSTELGRIAALLSAELPTQTPMQRRLAQFGRRLAIVALAICAAVFATGVVRGEPVLLMFLTAVSLAVAAIPEALPAVVTASLAIGARRMVKQNALVRRLPAVETLGSVTYVCSDKTGTLTVNRMRVADLYVGGVEISGEEPIPPEIARCRMFAALALSNDADAGADGAAIGDPTEVALAAKAAEAGYRKEVLSAEHPRLAEVPFDSARKRMTTFHRASPPRTAARADCGGEEAAGPGGGEVIAFTKGAPEQVLPLCTAALSARDGKPVSLADLAAAALTMAARGLRVIAVAERAWPALPEGLGSEGIESDLLALGLVGLDDPLRPESAAAVAACEAAGITPVMITGDHPATARAIARQAGIIDRDDAMVVTGDELARMDADALAERVEEVRVFARVAPDQKIRIVEALQARGEFVAVTGDGVNDAPALKRADIGVAMGKIGTDVAREAADMVLLDDNFATIVAAIREGRRIYDNTRKFIRYALAANSGELWTLFLAPFLGLPIPLLPIHILWVNLVTDGLPGLALIAEPEEADVLRRPPRPPDESLLARGVWQQIVWVGILLAAVTLGAQAWALHVGGHWQTMAFTVLTLGQMGNVLAIRSERASLFQTGLWSNRPLLAAVVLTVLLQLATVYVPALNAIFRTAPLTLGELALCAGLSAVVFVAIELEKYVRRRGGKVFPGMGMAM